MTHDPTQPPTERPATWGGSRGNRLPLGLYPPGAPIHVVLCTAGGRQLFRDARFAQPVFDLCACRSGTLACCLMPDHLHWLLADAATASEVVQRFKTFATRTLRRRHVRGPVWQRSFWDHVIRREESLEAVARYIVENPVRAGMVDEPGRYPYAAIQLRGPLGR